MTTRKFSVPALERLKKQIEHLEWLLDESGYSPGEWEARVTCDDEEPDGIVLGLALSPRGRKVIKVTSVPDPGHDCLDRERSFWIDGNHWYDEHAVGVLEGALWGEDEDEGEGGDEDDE